MAQNLRLLSSAGRINFFCFRSCVKQTLKTKESWMYCCVPLPATSLPIPPAVRRLYNVITRIFLGQVAFTLDIDAQIVISLCKWLKTRIRKTNIGRTMNIDSPVSIPYASTVFYLLKADDLGLHMVYVILL